MENQENILAAEALDAIGEIMNISMGSAATAVSNMLDKQVTITTPTLEQQQFKDIDCSSLEPAVIVKIKYVEGIEGVNVIMLRRQDMQVILNLLMGNEFTDDSEDFVFDELSMSAACEVMNQMMGASATALSEILGMPINISTPEAREANSKDEINTAFNDIGSEERVVAISFHMMIKDVLDTTFCCFLNTTLASRIVDQVSSVIEEEPEPQPSAPPPQPAPQPAAQQPAPAAPPPQQPQAPPPMPQAAPPQPAVQPMGATQPFVAPDFAREPMQFTTQPMPSPEQQMGYAGYPPQGMPPYGQPYGQPPYGQAPYGQPPYGYPPQAGPGGYVAPPQNVRNAEFPDFSRQGGAAVAPCGSNMGLLLNVQLDVSVIIGRARRKIRDIVEFGQGTVVELDKQTGAPAEIMVNGQLLAYGEVIVVGDNFGVRVTEIVGTKDLLELLDSNT